MKKRRLSLDNKSRLMPIGIWGVVIITIVLGGHAIIRFLSLTVTPAPTEAPVAIPAPTNTPSPTATATFSPTLTLTEIPCFSLLTPENGANLAAIGKVTFSWEAMPQAASYRLEFITPSGVVIPFETESPSINRYIESMPEAGTYKWQVTAYDVNEAILCIASLLNFTKPQSTPPRPTKNNNDGNQNPGGTVIISFDTPTP